MDFSKEKLCLPLILLVQIPFPPKFPLFEETNILQVDMYHYCLSLFHKGISSNTYMGFLSSVFFPKKLNHSKLSFKKNKSLCVFFFKLNYSSLFKAVYANKFISFILITE